VPQFGWHLDLGRCIGCHACAVACKAENNTAPQVAPLAVRFGRAVAVNYRFVFEVGEGSYPNVRRTFVTLACHHCAEPACVPACPVAAVTKSSETGLVQIDQDRCVGCRRCGWACPYGAPQFNETTRRVEKCTGCVHRLAKDLAPACVTTCPARALQFTRDFDAAAPRGVPPKGFASPASTLPSIRFLRSGNG